MDDVTALRDRLLDDLPVLSPNLRHPLTLGKAREVVAERLDALIAAVEARAALTPERCPAAKHHRVRTFQKGGIVGTTEDGEDFVFAPDALVADRCTACGRDFLAALPRPEEPRAERCAVCGIGRWVTAHDPEAGPSYHPFTPEAR